MPQSLDRVLIHIVFATKHREPVLIEPVRGRLHAYLATVVRNAGCFCLRVGGVSNHVHLAVRLSRTITIAALVEEIKTSSSKWLKTQDAKLAGFSWQRGYGVFSVNADNYEALLRYIDNQAAHHGEVTFESEYREILTRNGAEYDERYVWD